MWFHVVGIYALKQRVGRMKKADMIDILWLKSWLVGCFGFKKSRKENPQKLAQLSSRSHPRHLVGKKTAQKDITIDTTSDSQVNSNFPNRWSPASLTFNNYFYLFLYLYITTFRDSISDYIGPSPRDREKGEKIDERKKSKQSHPNLLQAQ